MIRASRSRSLIAGLLAIAMSITLSACLGYGQSHPDREVEGQSRARLYSSVADMTADSDAVIVGRVGDSRTVRDVDDVTDFAVSADDLAAMPFNRADADSGDTLPDTLRLGDVD